MDEQRRFVQKTNNKSILKQMNKIIVLNIGMLLLAFNLQAQDQSEAAMAQEVKEYANLYNMDAHQTYKTKRMVEMKYDNYEQLKVLEQSEPVLYEEKRRNLERQFRLGVKSILNESQLETYRTLREQEKTVLRQKIKQLQANGAEKTEIAKAVNELNAIE